jgi:hypothetical protein
VKGNYRDAVGHYTAALESGYEVLSTAKLSVVYSNRWRERERERGRERTSERERLRL